MLVTRVDDKCWGTDVSWRGCLLPSALFRTACLFSLQCEHKIIFLFALQRSNTFSSARGRDAYNSAWHPPCEIDMARYEAQKGPMCLTCVPVTLCRKTFVGVGVEGGT